MPTKRVVFDDDDMDSVTIGCDPDPAWDDDDGEEGPSVGWGPIRFHEDQAKESAFIADMFGSDGFSVINIRDWNRDEDELDDEAARWLERNDPEYQRNRVEARLNRALDEVGLTLEEARKAFAMGRMTDARRALRERVRSAVATLWDDPNRDKGGGHQEGRRDHMANVLECGRKSLYRLMDEKVTHKGT